MEGNSRIDALQKAEIESPDLILLDMVMPGKSGLEVSKILKTQQKTKLSPALHGPLLIQIPTKVTEAPRTNGASVV